MSFYITLPSNSSSNLFDNTISNFTTKLHIPIEFNRPYEVALVEFSYDHYWKINIGKVYYYHRDNIVFDINVDHRDGDSIEKLFVSINHQLNLKVLEHELNKYREIYTHSTRKDEDVRSDFLKRFSKSHELSRTNEFPFIIFNNKHHHIEINTIFNNDSIRFEGIIEDIFGLKSFLTSTNSPVKIDQKYDKGVFLINNIYIYSDIIKYQYIGDTLAPLLRTINIPTTLSTESVIYDSPHYIPVNKSSIDTINIKITDELGNNIRFERGKTILKLHFRPINNGF